MLVAAVLIGSILTTITQGFSILTRSREIGRANQILQEELETVRTYSWSNVTNTANFNSTNYTDGGIVYAVSRAVTNSNVSYSYASNNLKEITISLVWTNHSGTVVNLKMSTLVSKAGLNDYLF
jgi:hypothetical protein